MMVASLALPAALFAYLSWSNYGSTMRLADERINHQLDILHEHALKVFQTGIVLMTEMSELTRDLSDAEIRAGELALHRRLAALTAPLSSIQSLWVIDRDGYALLSNYIYPAPRTRPLTDREYFAAHVETERGLFVGPVLTPRFSDSAAFFSMSRRRPSVDGRFNGVLSVALPPSDFEKFYADLGHAPGSYYAMFREDGAILARHPETSRDAQVGMRATRMAEEVAGGASRGIYTSVSPIDGRERRFGYRKVAGFPVYVAAGLDMAAMRGEWLGNMGRHLTFGLPLTLLLFTALLVAMKRTRRLYHEADRREAAEGALRQSQRMEAIGQLTGGIAHDFNNLLMVISGSVERLKRTPRDEKEIRTLDMIATASKRGETLTRQLLSFSRRQALAPEPVDLSQRLPQLEEILHRSLRGDIAVTVEVPEAPCTANIDIAEFEVAIINLAVNARDAMPNGGELQVRLDRVALDGGPDGLTGPFLRLSVTDTGVGISGQVLPRVFEPFFTTKEVDKGTGLGLSQVYGFARQSGGTATITSMPGRGTTASIYLPASEAEPPPRPARAEATFRPPPGASVLLVEDNHEVAEVARSYLEELGFAVERAGTAQEALLKLRLGRFDLVFSDILMPGGMTGLDLAQEIRRIRPGLPVVLATGYSLSGSQAIEEGFTVLRKPYDLEALRDALQAELPPVEAREPA
jgi:two-component system NtrC family sensor kinase